KSRPEDAEQPVRDFDAVGVKPRCCRDQSRSGCRKCGCGRDQDGRAGQGGAAPYAHSPGAKPPAGSAPPTVPGVSPPPPWLPPPPPPPGPVEGVWPTPGA